MYDWPFVVGKLLTILAVDGRSHTVERRHNFHQIWKAFSFSIQLLSLYKLLPWFCISVFPCQLPLVCIVSFVGKRFYLEGILPWEEKGGVCVGVSGRNRVPGENYRKCWPSSPTIKLMRRRTSEVGEASVNTSPETGSTNSNATISGESTRISWGQSPESLTVVKSLKS